MALVGVTDIPGISLEVSLGVSRTIKPRAADHTTASSWNQQA
jgi:hypothetical protein